MNVAPTPLENATPVLIIGGGLVGASLAIALDAAGIAATLVETAAPRTDAQPSYDERNLALARATVNGLDAIGVWRHAATRANPIEHIHVSREGEFGSARIDAARQGVDALGWTLPARELGTALLRRLDECTRLTRLAPASLTGLEPLANGWRATVLIDGTDKHIDTSLLVGADGTDSLVRGQLGIEAGRHDYRQTLFVCTMTTERDHRNRAYERFADAGPIALLPLGERRCGLVLTVDAEEAEAIIALDDAGFVEMAQRRFGWRLGRFSRPGKRHPYVIRAVTSSSIIAPRAVLVGNAAQTVHPIGAQGFNLGLRDALTLAELVTAAADPGAGDVLARYAARREPDREGTISMSHTLVRLACLPQPLLAPLRSLALLAFDRLSPLRNAMARRGMGFRGEPPQAVLERLP
jgi:2-octaprenyl-6-methoxyphenol hydroxylase